MADWPPYIADGQHVDIYGKPSGAAGTTLTASATINTATTYTSLGQNTMDASGITIQCLANSAAAGYMIDIAISPNGVTWTAIISSLRYYFPRANNPAGDNVYFPIRIPSGEFIGARIQSTTASATLQVSVQVHGAGLIQTSPRSIVTTLGANPTLTAGKSLGAVVAANTMTNAALIDSGANVLYPIEWLYVGVMAANISFVNGRYFIRIQMGGASQTVLMEFTVIGSTNADYFIPRFVGPLAVHIPAGQSLYAAYAASATGLPVPELVLYGVS